MKKTFAFILAFVMLFAAFGTVAYADGMEYVFDRDYEGETYISAYRYSSYDISVPYEITPMGTGTIYMEQIRIEDGYCMRIYITNMNEDGKVTLTCRMNSGRTYEDYASICFDGEYLTGDTSLVAVHMPDEFDEDSCTLQHTISYSTDGVGYAAGTYTGVICYRVEIARVY